MNKPPLPPEGPKAPQVRLPLKPTITIPENPPISMPPQFPGVLDTQKKEEPLLKPVRRVESPPSDPPPVQSDPPDNVRQTQEPKDLDPIPIPKPPDTTPPRRVKPPKPTPPMWLPAMRAQLSRCDNFFCNKAVQKKFCNGYWNKLEECIDTLRQ
jgi:hypothetical protein